MSRHAETLQNERQKSEGTLLSLKRRLNNLEDVRTYPWARPFEQKYASIITMKSISTKLDCIRDEIFPDLSGIPDFRAAQKPFSDFL